MRVWRRILDMCMPLSSLTFGSNAMVRTSVIACDDENHPIIILFAKPAKDLDDDFAPGSYV